MEGFFSIASFFKLETTLKIYNIAPLKNSNGFEPSQKSFKCLSFEILVSSLFNVKC